MKKRQTPAQIIKAELKKAFPGVKFSCKYSSFSMGDDVHIQRKGGPTESEVEEIALHYQAGHFDGLTDMYEYTNDKPRNMTAKYVFCKRENDEDEIKTWIKELGIDTDILWDRYNIFESLSDVRYFMSNGIKNLLNKNKKNEGISFDEELNKKHKEMGWIIASYIVDLNYN